MDTVRFLRALLIFGAILGVSSILLFPSKPPFDSLLAEAGNTYLGPVGPVPGSSELIQIQVLIRDALDPSGLQITKVSFNQINIPLKPRDIYGNRGSASFQLPPGTYRLKWTVNRDRLIWPREIHHEEIVHISPRDNWVQIEIIGETAQIG